MNSIYILLGSNLGDPLAQIQLATKLIADEIGDVVDQSSIYESEAWGKEDQPSFLNQVILVETVLDATTTLDCCQKIEQSLGRIRKEKWGTRSIDIDILYFNSDIVNTTRLTIPHPYIHARRFTLEPLSEIASNYTHPTLNKTNRSLLDSCVDQLSVKRI